MHNPSQVAVHQLAVNWPDGVLININQLVSGLNKDILLKQLKTPEETTKWLQALIQYLELSQNERLGLEFPIYPNQLGDLNLQNEIYHEADIEGQFKIISKGLGRDLRKELLPKDFKTKFIQEFNVKEFLDGINSLVGNLQINIATSEQKQAIIDICCTFEQSKAPKRESWFELLNGLLPKCAKEKVHVNLKHDYNWESAEKWTLKMVCLLIQEAKNWDTFIQTYFDDESTAAKWVNTFLDFVFRNEDNKVALEYNIILTQDGLFKKYTDSIFREDNHKNFLDSLKELYKKQHNFPNPKAFLVHWLITNENLRVADVSILTRPIDDIFKDRSVEDKVKEGLEYHSLFIALKELTEDSKWTSLFPMFVEKQPVLFIKAFGAGSRVTRLLKIKKPIEELEKLDALTLTADQLKQLDDAAKVIGNAQSLIRAANELAEMADEIRWRQDVGNAAENSFLEALAEAHPLFKQPDNPDNGKDFVVCIGDLKYSIEIKSAIENRESVKMSLRQGEDASASPGSYALCVISRPYGTLTNKEQFINNAKFVTNIGVKIGDKVDKWKNGITGFESNDDVSVQLDSRTGFVNIKKAIWKNEMGFAEFVDKLKSYFNIGN